MDWNIFWSAFGAIGTTAGSLITAFAVVVAVIQYRQPIKKRLKIRFNSGIISLAEDKDSSIFVSTISIINTGIREIDVVNIVFRINKKDLQLKFSQLVKINGLKYFDEIKFPKKIAPEDSIIMNFENSIIKNTLNNLIKENSASAKNKILIVVTDSSGKCYYKKIKSKVRNFINVNWNREGKTNG